MTNTDMPTKKIHEGRNIKRFREMLGIKQEILASELGGDWTQSKISHLEAKDTIEPGILEQVARVLKVTPEDIRNFNEDAAIINIQNNYEGSNPNAVHVNTNNNHCVVNYEGKWIEAMEENKKLFAALLKEKDERINLLEKLASEKKN